MLHPEFKHWLGEDDQGRVVFNSAFSYFFSHGGRGGGKTEYIAEALALVGTQKPLRILCAREFQGSIEDSVKGALLDKMNEHFPGFYTEKNNKIFGINGTEFMFVGLARNLGSVKGKKGIDICWVEEAQYISARAWEILDPTIRDANSVMILSMNREELTSVIDRTFIQSTPPPRTSTVFVNLDDNPFDVPKLHEKSDHMKRIDYEAWRHIYGGEPRMVSKAEVLFGKWRVKDFDTPANAVFYHGADWSNGGAHPHALVRSFILGNDLYIDWELKINSDLDEDFMMAVDTCPTLDRETHGAGAQYTIYCDVANPANGRKLKKAGFKAMDAAKNFSGKKSSVQAGIEYLRRFDNIYINPRCKGAIEECKGWRWKEDPRSGDILPILNGINDDVMAALRYSHYKMVRKGI